MWIVRLALRRPYTFVVAALLVGVFGVLTIFRMSTDVLPAVDIPVVSVVWQYNGLPPQEVERRIVTVIERAMTTTVNDIEHIESNSISGYGVIKIYFQPTVKIEQAVAQVTSINQTLVRAMPPGTGPPLILQYSASNVPILQAVVSSDVLPESELFDQAQNFIRTPLATVQGAQVLLPSGGKSRAIMVDLNLPAMYARNVSPADVSTAINQQNVILPTGTAKLGSTEYNVQLNSSPDTVEELNNLPVKVVNGRTVFMRDIANVRDGFAVQQNIVRVDGKRAALLPILKSAGASTLEIVKRVRNKIPQIKAGLPEGLNVSLLFDQSVFVRESVKGVLVEGAIAACLTGLMILVFLGSLRSTLIVTISIPLAILVSILCLAALGYTLNLMTLGGLALAVGILVDDATVEIENIHRNLAEGKPLRKAILDGAQQIAVPAFVATTAICIVFTPVVFISGAARFLFVPLALAVVFAVAASYLLSRTIVPTMVLYLLKDEQDLYKEGDHEAQEGALKKLGKVQGVIWKFHEKFEVHFERFRDRYKNTLTQVIGARKPVLIGFMVWLAVSLCLVPFLGRDFFPRVDAGQIRLHVRAPAGSRIEETERRFGQIETLIRHTIPAGEVEMILSNMGLPPGGVNQAIGDGSTISTSDGEILVALKEGNHGPTEGYVRQLRRKLRQEFPDITFFFQSADIVGQTLNFGLASPIDVQVSGPNRNADKNLALARDLMTRIARIPGAADVHLAQILDAPQLKVNVDRNRAAQAGLTQRDVAQGLLISLSGSAQSAPNFWLNPQNGVNYQITVQTPQYQIQTLDDLMRTPIVPSGQGTGRQTDASATAPQILENLTQVSRSETPVNVSHYNVQPTYNVQASLENRDLGGVAGEIEKIIEQAQKKAPKGTQITLRGQVESMNASYLGLGLGLVFAVVLVYALMVINFQSWIDPLIIICALPGALSGIVWMLFVTQTTLSIPALMGAIMCMGVATANSILLVTFANDQRREGKDALGAAIEAGYTRLRPVLMTAGAMVVGMAPMALGVSEGGEQNAPLGRAVIGGLLIATPATLFLVPAIYSVLRKKAFVDPEEVAEKEEAEQGITGDGSSPSQNGSNRNGHSGDGHDGDGHEDRDGRAERERGGVATRRIVKHRTARISHAPHHNGNGHNGNGNGHRDNGNENGHKQ